jgi:hypothetical protein
MSEENNKAPAAPQASVPPTGPGSPAAAELTVQDLSVLKTIIEVAQTRGAFKANELEAVGKTYNKLDTFLTTVSNQQVNAQKDAPATPAAAPKGDASTSDVAAAMSGTPGGV